MQVNIKNAKNNYFYSADSKANSTSAVNNEKKVFISHSSSDKAIASDIRLMLINRFKFKVYLSGIEYDSEAIGFWFDEITKNIDDCDVFIVLISKEHESRKWIYFESGYALKSEVIIIPVCLFDAQSNIEDAIGPPFSYFHVVHIKNLESWIEKQL